MLMAIKSAYSASLSCSSFIPFENSKMGLMNSNCRPATNRREQGEAVTIVSPLSPLLSRKGHQKSTAIHHGVGRTHRQGQTLPLCSSESSLYIHYWWAPITVAELLQHSNCKITLFLGFPKALNAPQPITGQQAKGTKHQLSGKSIKMSESHKHNIYTVHSHSITSFTLSKSHA